MSYGYSSDEQWHNDIYHSVFEYARMKHKGQFRKDGVEEYINHPFRVSQIVRHHGGSIEQQCAALLHDVVEDTDTSLEQLESDVFRILVGLFTPDDVVSQESRWMAEKIAKYVNDLTCKYTPKAYPNLNRAKRKELELAEFLKLADEGSKVIKFADIIDNLSSIEKLDPAFAEKYLFEDFRIIRALKIDHPIYQRVVEVFKEAVGKML